MFVICLKQAKILLFTKKNNWNISTKSSLQTSFLITIFLIQTTIYQKQTLTDDCEDPTCSKHGKCVESKCYCDNGWSGSLCSIRDESYNMKCSNRGAYDEIMDKCICNLGYSGKHCERGQLTNWIKCLYCLKLIDSANISW